MGEETKLLNYFNQNFEQIDNLEKHDSGGQKVVFKGQHKLYGDIVLKVIHIESNNTVKRTLRELDIASNLDARHFAELYNFDKFVLEDKQYMYVIEEFIEGDTLRKILNQENNFNLERAIKLGKEILKALMPIHDKNLVHRDIKPENIILTGERIVLLDFGIARDLEAESLTADEQFFGPMTLGYAAPEQIKNRKEIICNRTDLFAWGILMYECLKGYNPFKKDCRSPKDVIYKSCKYDPPKVQCNNEILSDMISKCLNKSVHRRPKSARYIINLLD